MDLMPTLAEMAQATYPDSMGGSAILPLAGHSLFPVLKGETDQIRTEETSLAWEHMGRKALRQGNWKLVADRGEENWHLYDVSVDRTESNDLAVTEPGRFERMIQLWEAWADSVGARR